MEPAAQASVSPTAPDRSSLAFMQRLSQAIEQCPFVVCITDTAGHIDYVNPSFTEVTGYPFDEVRGRSCALLKSGRVSPPHYAGLWQAIAGGGTWRGEFENRRKDGRVYWEQAAIRGLRNDQGTIAWYVKVAEDITERKRFEHALQESERSLRRVFDGSTDPILLLDDTTFVDCNQATLERLGWASKEQVVGRHPAALSPERQPDGRPSAEKAAEMIALAREKGTHHFEWDHLRADGSILPVDITLTSINHQGRAVFHVVWRDVSDRKRAEAEQQRLQAQLLHAQKMEAIGRLAGGVAHDFNNMLGVILGHAEMALDQVAEASPLYADLRAIRNAAQRSSNLTRQLLGFARRQTAQPRVIDLNETIADTSALLRRLIGEEIDFVWNPGPHLWPVRIDPTQVDQLLTNLAVNARDALPDGGRLTIATSNTWLDAAHCAAHPEVAPGPYVLMAVSDTGVGMPPDVLEHVFEPFFTTKPVGEGTGLGLATVYGIVQQNQGLVAVESTPGRGTTISVYLPKCGGETVEADPERPPAAPGGAERILVVEDEPAILSLARTILERHGYAVQTARTPADALAAAASDPLGIDLLVTDVVMPGMNGRELVERLRADHPGLKYLFISGYTADIIAHRGVLSEDLHFVQKPFTVAALARKVREVLDR